MSFQLLINILIAFLWTMLQNELNSITFIVGYLIGLVVVYSMRRFFPSPFYLKKVVAIIKFIYVLIREIITSGIFVLSHVIRREISFIPGIFALKTKLKGDWEITVLSLLITLTPGSTVLEVSPEGDILYIHAMDMSNDNQMLLQSIDAFEKAIMGVTRDV